MVYEVENISLENFLPEWFTYFTNLVGLVSENRQNSRFSQKFFSPQIQVGIKENIFSISASSWLLVLLLQDLRSAPSFALIFDWSMQFACAAHGGSCKHTFWPRLACATQCVASHCYYQISVSLSFFSLSFSSFAFDPLRGISRGWKFVSHNILA